MNAIVELEWEFSPRNYIKEELSCPLYTLTISEGKVKAKIDYEIYKANNRIICGQLHEFLDKRFRAVEVITHRSYELSYLRAIWTDHNGHPNIEVALIGIELKVKQGTLDSLIIDENGHVISDSKKNRIEKEKNFIELITKYNTDLLLTELLHSYSEAVRDPGNEFFHLYEIREAVMKPFKNEKEAKKALDISNTQWSDIGSLCNNKQIKQGRHRGQHQGKLRDATEEELQKARDLAMKMIFAYANYLEKGTSQIT